MKAWRHSRRTSVVDTFLDFSTLKFAWKPSHKCKSVVATGAVRRAEGAPQRRGYSICEMGSISLTRITGHFSLVRVFWLLFASVIFTGASWANAQSQSGQAKESRAVQSPAAKRGLNFAIGARGPSIHSRSMANCFSIRRRWQAGA